MSQTTGSGASIMRVSHACYYCTPRVLLPQPPSWLIPLPQPSSWLIPLRNHYDWFPSLRFHIAYWINIIIGGIGWLIFFLMTTATRTIERMSMSVCQHRILLTTKDRRFFLMRRSLFIEMTSDGSINVSASTRHTMAQIFPNAFSLYALFRFRGYTKQ